MATPATGTKKKNVKKAPASWIGSKGRAAIARFMGIAAALLAVVLVLSIFGKGIALTVLIGFVGALFVGVGMSPMHIVVLGLALVAGGAFFLAAHKPSWKGALAAMVVMGFGLMMATTGFQKLKDPSPYTASTSPPGPVVAPPPVSAPTSVGDSGATGSTQPREYDPAIWERDPSTGQLRVKTHMPSAVATGTSEFDKLCAALTGEYKASAGCP